MTRFKSDMVFAILVWLAGRTVLDQHAGTDLSENGIMQALQWGELAFGYVFLTGGAVLAFLAVLKKMGVSS